MKKITPPPPREIPSPKPQAPSHKKIQITILCFLFFNAAFFSPLLWRGAGGEAFAQSGEKWSFGLNAPSGTAAFGTSNNFPLIIKTFGTEKMRITENGNLGIGITNPIDKLQVAGRVSAIHFKADSLMQALDMKAASAEFAIALITGNLNVNGQVTAGSLTVSGNTQLANVTANNAAINGNLSALGGLTTNNITSSSGNIDFGNNSLSTSGNISSSNISSLTTDVSNLQSSINNIQSSQWSTNPDSSISFPGNVFVKTLNATDFVSIGSFRFSNGGAVPVPIIRDTIRSPNEVVVHSEAEKIMLSANQVEAQQQLGVGKTPGTNIALDVLGNIQASGSISSSSITTSQLAINGAIEADTVHSRKQMLVNNSLKLAKEDTDAYAEISAVNSGIALVLQKDTANNVGIGTTPAAGEKLTVAGNVGISGNLRMTNFSGSDNRILFIDANGNVNKMQNPCPGLEPFWKTDGNFIPANSTCSPFIGTTTPDDFVLKTDNVERIKITGGGNIDIGSTLKVKATGDFESLSNVFLATQSGNVGIGTTTPSEKLEVDGNIRINEHDIYFRSVAPDGNHGLGWYGVDANFNQNKLFAGTDVNGPVLYGWNGGALGVKQGMNENVVLRWNTAGSVGISAPHIPTDPVSGQLFKLAVGGKVLATEYVVLQLPDWPWPDYVFKQKLLSWKSFVKQVDSLGHFPWLPSAQKVRTQNGFSLGEVQVGHLAVTEYLYRYLGETKNEVAELKQENKELKQENAELKARVEKIEKALEQK